MIIIESANRLVPVSGVLWYYKTASVMAIALYIYRKAIMSQIIKNTFTG
jgi:hypothetical protein